MKKKIQLICHFGEINRFRQKVMLSLLLPNKCENCILLFVKEKNFPTVYLFRFVSYWFDTSLLCACYIIGKPANANNQLVDDCV